MGRADCDPMPGATRARRKSRGHRGYGVPGREGLARSPVYVFPAGTRRSARNWLTTLTRHRLGRGIGDRTDDAQACRLSRQQQSGTAERGHPTPRRVHARRRPRHLLSPIFGLRIQGMVPNFGGELAGSIMTQRLYGGRWKIVPDAPPLGDGGSLSRLCGPRSPLGLDKQASSHELPAI
jgi:hypothetical protein